MARIRTALRVLALSASSVAIACGDGEAQVSPGSSNATGGANTSVGGGSAITGGVSSTTATGGNTAFGTSTGGAGPIGGSGSVSTAGSSALGGSSSTGGATGTAAGASNEGGSSGTAVGGSNSGGTVAQTSVGGTGASTSTLTSAVGGTAVDVTGGTGPLQTGGAPSTGGAATGGSSAISCTASYVAPTENQALANAQDLDGNCSNGIQYNVVVATNAADTTAADLVLSLGSGDTTHLATTTVAGALARFNNVTLPASGQVTLIATVAGASCSATETVSLSCAGAPGCTITSPTITATHPALNGVPATQGDRVSSVGAPYQVAFEVSTDLRDGQPVVLTVDGSTNYQTTASAGKARFGGVLMAPDGNHTAQATCTAGSGLSSTTALLTFPVDTATPNFTPQKGTGSSGGTLSALNNGDHFAYADDADAADGLQIKFCGASTSSDAVDISAVNPNANNFCVRRGNNAPTCAPVLSANGSENPAGSFACVNIDCPGDGPFSVDLSMTDAAGNPTTVTRTGITCASTSPSVTFIDPISDSGQFTDVSRRILAADNNNPETVRRDKNTSRSGAQYDVIACTSAPAGSTAILYTGYMGQTLNQTATTTVTADSTTAPVCSGGNLITFSSSVVTLPESKTDSNYNLLAATELRVTVTDPNLAIGSAVADVWVDSVSPTLFLQSPVPFCGQYFTTTGNDPAAVVMTFGSPIPVTVTVTGSGSQTFTGASSFSVATVNVQLPVGTDTVSAVAIKPSSNYASFAACEVTAGATPPPAIAWQSPVYGNLLTAVGNTGANKVPDGNAAAGWQGTLKVCTNVDIATYTNATVTFTASVGSTQSTIGSQEITGPDGTCPNDKPNSATLSNVTVPEGENVVLMATTDATGTVGTASITVDVATMPPGAVTIKEPVEITDRRKTSFTPKWTGATGSVQGYKVRVSKTPFASQTDFDNALDVPYTGGGTCPTDGCSVLIEKCHKDSTTQAIYSCYVENDYYFAVAPVDGVGNQGSYSATTSPARAPLYRTILTSPIAGQRFGRTIDGSGDLNADGFADLVVTHNEGKDVYIYFGSTSGYDSAPFDIQGPQNYFGYSAAIVGDVNGDGIIDLAIGSPAENASNGAVYLYFGKRTWTAPVLPDTKITINSTSAAPDGDANFAQAYFGWSIARIGDYNGDGIDDFVVGAPYYGAGSLTGHLTIVLGKKDGWIEDIALPAEFGTYAIGIQGEPGSKFGYSAVGIGHFFGDAKHTAVVTSAIATSSNSGALFAFQGIDTTAAIPNSLDSSSRISYVTGPAGSYFGEEGVYLVGDVGPAGQLAISVPAPRISAPGEGVLLTGTSLTGPFAQQLVLTSAEIGAAKEFAELLIGSAYAGVDTPSSFIGSTHADLIVGTKVGAKPRVFIIDGASIPFPGTATAQSLTQVTLDLPTPWTDFSNHVTPIADLNGDTYADIAIGQTDYTGTPKDGSVVVYY